MTDLPYAAKAMMLKLRKSMAASLNAARFTELLPYLPGWTIEKARFVKQSDGGWLVKEVPGGEDRRGHFRADREDGRIHIRQSVVTGEGAPWYEETGRAEAERKIAHLKTVLFPALTAIDGKNNGKWMVKDVQLNTFVENAHTFSDLSFEFFATKVSGFIITSPEGLTYEVFGDYKNGAMGAQTFEKFFHWAVENSSIMDQILTALEMEPVEEKVDPRKPYTPPITASEETKQIFAILVDLTNGVREEQKTERVAYMNRVIEQYLRILATDEDRAKKLYSNSMILMRTVDRKTMTMVDGWEAEVDLLATREVRDMQNMFVYKNTRKLAAILTAKGSVGKTVVKKISVYGGVIEAELAFSFDDGSSFNVRQSIVASYTRDHWGNITDFYRFPTTFHDIVLPGGGKLGSPSEERMNEIWAVA